MRLKSLELLGFKSFAAKTVLHFTPGLTAIVGPNGCGKSNIVDALRWVMGEQSAHHLRGHQMEDVIFSGSQTQAATGMSEVSLILDNEDGRGPAQYSGFSEIMVTRRLFRSGETEYLINKVPCRLKDIVELFLGTGIGNKAYSIIEQGRVEEMVNAKPEERRVLIEEAAGTTKYRSRKVTAERKLERTEQNLLRVNDIIREIERQIRSIEFQARKAERYKSLRGELKAKEIARARLQRHELEREIAVYEDRGRTLEDELTRLLTALSSKEAEAEATRLKLLEVEKEIGGRQEEIYGRKVQTHGEEQRLDFSRRDLSTLHEALRASEDELVQMRDKRLALDREIAELQKVAEEVIQLSLFEEASLKEREEKLAAMRSASQRLQSDLEREKFDLMESASQLSHLRNERLMKGRQQEELERELARRGREASGCGERVEGQLREQRGRRARLEFLGTRLQEIDRDIAEATEKAKRLLSAEEEREKQFEALKGQIQESRSRLSSLQELQRNYEGCQEGVRSIMLKRQGAASSNGICGLMAEVIDVPKPFEKALTAVLGERLQYVIVRDLDEGVSAIEYLKAHASGRGSFVALELARKEARSGPPVAPEIVAPLLDKVTVKDGYAQVAELLLGNVAVVQDLKSGIELWRRNGFVNTLVTLDGEVIDPSGVVTGGSAEHLEAGFLSRKRSIKEIEELLSRLEGNLGVEQAKLAEVREEMERVEAGRSGLREEAHGLDLERVRLEALCLQTDQEIGRLQEEVGLLEEEGRELAGNLSALVDSVRAVAATIEEREQEAAQRESALEEKQRESSQLCQQLEQMEPQVVEALIRATALGQRKEHNEITLVSRLQLKHELDGQVGSRELQAVETRRKIGDLEEAVRALEVSLSRGRAALSDLEAALGKARQRYRDVSARLADVEEGCKQLRPLIEGSKEERNRLQLSLSEKRFTLQHLCEDMRQRCNMDLLGAEPLGDAEAASLSDNDLQLEIEELRARLERMGEVNLAAIGELEELTARHQFLTQQRQDLEKSIGDLRQTITKLNRLCRVRFRETFDEINQKFQEIFPRLFRGGRARLVLTDENDMLETGVDVVAQPPGKKLQSITLLSGGEKALTAISLLVALFLTKPAPFCFLDEVDAPLDDNNIDRFNDLVKEMSAFSQFVLITHNKRTMQGAEVLYGITMSEPGVSKVVSVRMTQP